MNPFAQTTMHAPNQKPIVGGSFIRLIQSQPGGITPGELDQHLAEVLEAVSTTGKKAELKLTLYFGRNGTKGVKITAEITPKLPKPERAVSFAFVGPNGELLQNDPDQLQMPFTVADGGAAPAPAVAPAAPAAR